MQRRTFLQGIGAAGLGLVAFRSALGLPATAVAGATGRVVVVGGGMGGTTVAKFLRLWGGAGLDVTLVEPNATYYSNIFSNMVLTGERSLTQLGFNYATLSSKYGVKVVTASVTSILIFGSGDPLDTPLQKKRYGVFHGSPSATATGWPAWGRRWASTAWGSWRRLC